VGSDPEIEHASAIQTFGPIEMAVRMKISLRLAWARPGAALKDGRYYGMG
jgi:hypothetical protein